MDINLSTLIITKGTCLIRGESTSDSKSKKRFFGYYGEEKDIAKFCKSKDFVSRYAKNDVYQYHRVDKNILLMKLPYISLGIYTDEELELAIDMATQFIGYVDLLKDKSDTVNHYGYEETITAIFNVLLPFLDDDEITDVLANIRSRFSVETTINPDTIFSDLVCELGFKGWVRQAVFNKYTPSDELFMCNIDEMEEDGFISESEECNLGECV